MSYHHRRSAAHVDHRNPIHDTVCRCRACKPPLVGERPRLDAAALIVCLPLGLLLWALLALAARLAGVL